MTRARLSDVRGVLSPRRWTTALGWLLTAAAAVALISRSVSLPWQPAIVLASFSRYVALAAVGSAALFAIRRQRLATVLAIVLTGWLVVAEVPLFVGRSPTVHGPALTVLQANVRLGSADPARLVAQVRADDVDVLTVDELTPDETSRLTAAGLGTTLRYRFVAPEGGGLGTGIWSRYPLGDRTRHDDFAFAVLSVSVAVPGAAPVDVWAVHLLPPWPYASATWVREIARLGPLIDAAGPTTLVAGDFNATYDNRQFPPAPPDRFPRCRETRGVFSLGTYPRDRSFPPILTLDHLLLRRADPAAVRTVPLTGSDHRGLLVRVTVPALE